ncbi:AzlD domain-containing protein [Aeribacillus sp. FSL K6-8394]|uniref:AzlD domain-containing protein n=1 Tax=Aeribacillus sp. FSL K6-8394 TaxID=2954570 RepID=UPI0030F4E7E2
MEVRWKIFLIILGTGIVTLIPRVVPLLFLSRIKLPEWFLSWLSFVPVTVMAALLTQSLLFDDGQLSPMANKFELLAIIPTFLVALLFRSLLGAVLVGMISVSLLRWIF